MGQIDYLARGRDRLVRMEKKRIVEWEDLLWGGGQRDK